MTRRGLYKVVITRAGGNPITYFVRAFDTKEAVYLAMADYDKKSPYWRASEGCQVSAELQSGRYILR